MYNILYMDQDTGGLSSSERQRRTAAEIARRRVLAAYSSTVQNLRKIPASPNRYEQNHSQNSNYLQQSHGNEPGGHFISFRS